MRIDGGNQDRPDGWLPPIRRSPCPAGAAGRAGGRCRGRGRRRAAAINSIPARRAAGCAPFCRVRLPGVLFFLGARSICQCRRAGMRIRENFMRGGAPAGEAFEGADSPFRQRSPADPARPSARAPALRWHGSGSAGGGWMESWNGAGAAGSLVWCSRARRPMNGQSGGCYQ